MRKINPFWICGYDSVANIAWWPIDTKNKNQQNCVQNFYHMNQWYEIWPFQSVQSQFLPFLSVGNTESCADWLLNAQLHMALIKSPLSKSKKKSLEVEQHT